MEYKDIVSVLREDNIRKFVAGSLNESMSNLGFSEVLINDFLENILDLDLESFIEKHKEELANVQLGHFFGELVPKYFNQNVVVDVPSTGKVLDLGCGRGTLIKQLLERNPDQEVVGIDIKEEPEWVEFKNKGIKLEVVKESDFLTVLEKEHPDVVTATWVFHHMEYDQQKRYISALFDSLKDGSTLVVLEDSYAENVEPENGKQRHEAFMAWGREDRYKIMGVLDWLANRVFSMRTSMPVPFAYRTLEEWGDLFEEVGFKVLKKRFIGFPDNRDINTPQSLLVLSK